MNQIHTKSLTLISSSSVVTPNTVILISSKDRLIKSYHPNSSCATGKLGDENKPCAPLKDPLTWESSLSPVSSAKTPLFFVSSLALRKTLSNTNYHILLIFDCMLLGNKHSGFFIFEATVPHIDGFSGRFSLFLINQWTKIT